jgi:hypothetical protein
MSKPAAQDRESKPITCQRRSCLRTKAIRTWLFKSGGARGHAFPRVVGSDMFWGRPHACLILGRMRCRYLRNIVLSGATSLTVSSLAYLRNTRTLTVYQGVDICLRSLEKSRCADQSLILLRVPLCHPEWTRLLPLLASIRPHLL